MKKIKVGDFLKTDFRNFSKYDCDISIPNIVDGFKISQRKVVWTLVNNPKTYTVEQLSSLAASYTCYHHGATNLAGVAVGLAQNFKGSNNVNWLEPDGQFGNILNHNSASPRYISTKLSSNWTKWFSKDDEAIMEYEIEDGEITEPKYFIPLVPTILFNGSEGIGTGYSTKILPYNPIDVIENVKREVRGEELLPMTPWFDGYKGTITKIDGQTTFIGAFEKTSLNTIRITELPYGYDLESYKEVLIDLMENGTIKDFDDASTENGWDITIHANRVWCAQHPDVILDALKLIKRTTENIVVWDEKGKIHRFHNPESLIKYFVRFRLQKVEERRLKMIDNLQVELDWMQEKHRFIDYFIANSESFTKLTKDQMFSKLEELGYKSIDRLLQIRIYNLTSDEMTKLESDIADTSKQVEKLKKTTRKAMYLDDLKKIKI